MPYACGLQEEPSRGEGNSCFRLGTDTTGNACIATAGSSAGGIDGVCCRELVPLVLKHRSQVLLLLRDQ